MRALVGKWEQQSVIWVADKVYLSSSVLNNFFSLHLDAENITSGVLAYMLFKLNDGTSELWDEYKSV